jgi:hypothetical protein
MTDESRKPPDSLDPGSGSAADEERAQFAADEQAQVRAEWNASEGRSVACPRCAVAMHPRTIGGGSFGLGYARRRVWLLCPHCRRSVIFDAARGTRN